ncbi:hypothetical protein KI387_028059 [Taxus chinensis]|uniref:non-specific serine/threonine protein kinase n=1 Tax=Taxus chinensis TaxID=29808 RepID=A0AA38L3S9_TAXCH|nr:hypothetical protein KI387_028059 [Taxus chinensis]
MENLPLAICIVIVSMNLGARAGNLSFTLPPLTSIREFGTAFYNVESDTMILTPSDTDGDPNWSFGLATYKKSVPLWKYVKNSSDPVLASFTCHFKFSMTHLESEYGSDYGDGLTFFMAPFNWEPPVNATGQWLGLFDETTNGNISNQIVAVEFDTFKNDPFDEDDNHVGIDVNTIVSQVSFSLSGSGLRLNDGSIWDAWLDYDGRLKRLRLFVACYDTIDVRKKPKKPTLVCDIDLSHFLPNYIKVGFSASTSRNSMEMHVIHSWEFSSKYSWQINTGESPSPTTGENVPLPAGSPSPTVGQSPSRAVDQSPLRDGSLRNNKREVVVLSVVAIVVVLAIGGFSALLARRWRINSRENNRGKKESRKLDKRFSQRHRKFSYAELRTATKNFRQSEMLGKGGFGGVYRGMLPSSNDTVAIKRISQGSKQGEKEYISEVTIISQLRHRNLVQLLGWCHEKRDLVLVYEFLPGGSLDKYLFGEQQKGHLDWGRRYQIACDIASALIYLHEDWDQRVVHRDIKASNVMLDGNFNAKLGDFGLARIVERNRAASHTTVVAGTFGYAAPEYVSTGKASLESDVFSFGAVALEIACGRRPVDQSLDDHNWRLVEWVWDLYGRGKILDAVDRKLGGNFDAEEMKRLMLIGLLCSHPDPKARLTIRQVINILRLEAEVPHVPPNFPVAVYSSAPDHRSSFSPNGTIYSTAQITSMFERVQSI